MQRDGDVFILTMNHGENRWTTNFTRAMAEAIDDVEASDGPAALVTCSADPKFFSNGLDVEWVTGAAADDHPGGDRAVFGQEFMAVMGRLITLPVPTVAAVGGHAFGAGFMLALTHDVRIARSDRGFLCANELQIGLTVPRPEVALFRHKLSAPAFHETVILAKRWTGPAAVASGFVEAAVPFDDVIPTAIERARQLAPLAANRDNFGWQKEQAYGTDAVLNELHGAAHLLREYGTRPASPS